MSEVWMDVQEALGCYQVSNFGNVKSLKRTCMTYKGPRIVPEKMLNGSFDKHGYVYVTLCMDGKTYPRMVHRLVCTEFIPNPENKRTVNHINGIKNDNRLENLEWATFSENNLHACRTGLKKALIGIDHGRVKLTEIEAREIKYSDKNITCKDVGLLYGVSSALVCLIRNNKKWKHI